MTIENIEQTPAATATPAQATDNSYQEVELLKAQIAAQAADLDLIANSMLSNIPDGLKALIPDGLSPAEKIKWYQKALGAGLLVKPAIPETDTRKPGVLPQQININELPPIARMSHGYGKN